MTVGKIKGPSVKVGTLEGEQTSTQRVSVYRSRILCQAGESSLSDADPGAMAECHGLLIGKAGAWDGHERQIREERVARRAVQRGGPALLKQALAIFGLMILAGAARAEDTVNVYNWEDYISEHTIPGFERETGVKVHYDVYDGNDMLEAKMLVGQSDYDVVVPSWGYLGRMMRAGVFRKLDKTHIPNLANLDPSLMAKAAEIDPGNAYGVPYGISSTGLGMNLAKVRAILGPDAPLDTWDLVFDPAIVSKLAQCGVGIVDEPSDVLPIAQHYLGLTPYSDNAADYRQAIEVVKKIRQYIKEFNSDSYHTDLVSGELCLVVGWSNDIANVRRRTRGAGQAEQIRFVVPASGAPFSIDFMAIPKDAPHPENAERW